MSLNLFGRLWNFSCVFHDGVNSFNSRCQKLPLKALQHRSESKHFLFVTLNDFASCHLRPVLLLNHEEQVDVQRAVDVPHDVLYGQLQVGQVERNTVQRGNHRADGAGLHVGDSVRTGLHASALERHVCDDGRRYLFAHAFKPVALHHLKRFDVGKDL